MRLLKSFSYLAFAALLLGLASATAQANSLMAGSQGRIRFQSVTAKTMFDLARKNQAGWSNTTVWGDLTLPATREAKAPAVVLMHGSAGVTPSMKQWVTSLTEIGVAVFVVDSFGPRGAQQTMNDQTAVPYAAFQTALLRHENCKAWTLVARSPAPRCANGKS
jgi:predicted alpha/beta-fold hydrolase